MSGIVYNQYMEANMNDFDFNKRMQKLIEIRDRNNEMKRLRQDGWTLQRIADKYGLTRARVQQIVGRVQE
jgi:DNA-directed RNA polymerase sigma subunit (sigma70/sigma32)